MNPTRSNLLKLAIAVLLGTFASTIAIAQDLTPGLIYTCNGERLGIENCNIRDTSDNATCMVGHLDHIMPNGLMQYTTMTRAALKKLFPTCTQPTAKNSAAAHAFQQRQQDTYNAKKADDQLNAIEAHNDAVMSGGRAQPGQIAPPKNAEERAMRRCVSSGRLASSCTGNALLGAFSQMLSGVLGSGDDKQAASSGPTMAGVFVGPGNWRLDFIDGGVLVNCSFLSPNQTPYSVSFSNGRAILKIDTAPRPLLLTLHADNTITGPAGPVTIDGVVPGGYSAGSSTPGHTETSTYTTTERINSNQAGAYNQSQLTNTGGGTYDAATTHTNSTYVPGTSTPGYTTFAPKRATCSAVNLSTHGATTGIQTMQTDLLKGMFGGDKGPPTPPGIRMHGIYADAAGFSVQFFPESVILGCGPDAARAYPYTVEAGSTGALIKISAPDHPLTLAIKSDNTLDPASTASYQVHGRIVTGQDDNDNFTFAPMERSCNLATLTPASAIPSGAVLANASNDSTMMASAPAPSSPGAPSYSGSPSYAGSPASPSPAAAGGLATPTAPLGNATLSITSGFPPQPGTPNPLAGHPYTLLRSSIANIVTGTGIAIPPGSSPFKVLGIACGNRSPDCQTILNAVRASAASAARADANGSAILPGLPPGTYYLMISAQYNQKALVWDHPIQLRPGPNNLTLNQQNATPIN